MKILRNIHHIDVQTFCWCLDSRYRHPLERLSRAVSFTADGPLYLLIAIFFVYLERWDTIKLLAISFVIERLCYFICKNTCKRDRPPESIEGFTSAIVPSDQFSFPSGHTSAAFLMAAVLEITFPGSSWLFLPWACAVGISRFLLGVHFPTDVVAGGLMGFFLLHGVAAVLNL